MNDLRYTVVVRQCLYMYAEKLDQGLKDPFPKPILSRVHVHVENKREPPYEKVSLSFDIEGTEEKVHALYDVTCLV